MIVLYLIIGLLAGVISGFVGIGGGVIVVPALVYMVGLSQHQAQGTTLAMMIPPIGLLAVIKYYNQGNVKIDIAALMCIGFFVGGFLGAKFVHNIPAPLLKKLFGLFLLAVSLKMIISK